MAQLLNSKLLSVAVEKFAYPESEKRLKCDEIIKGWQTAFKDHDLSKAKETSLQGKFFAKFFCEILGYTMQDEGFETWTLKQEAKTEVDGKEADGSLGFYTKNSSQTRCVIELKDAQCSLDSKQCSRENKQTPVEQAFQYLYKFADCDWVIVSNFRCTRLYHKSKGQTAYIEFDILNLHEEREFKKFYFCLCAANLIDKSANSPMDLLIKQSSAVDIDITKEFYAEFKKIRKILFNHIVENNPDYDKKLLLEKTQKLLDRFIFIFFCEDTAGLLPHNTVENIYKMAQNSFSLEPCRIWEQFRGLFVAIDKGNSNVNPPINAYNGGLFAYDEILDKLIIKDEMFEHLKELARYDFESDLNVNILGHIFEQSLSDLEQLKNEIDGVETQKNKSIRKVDGIHYTPEYITHYIVKNTIDRYIEEHPEELSTIKILDSSCGSGAFLNQAHSALRRQYQIQTDRKIQEVKGNLNLFQHTNIIENNRTILLNNLFGIDINPESTEITKLALWLKTANKTAPLQNLDKNIKCGNSLLYDWHEGNNNGKFDVIIGNPPYIKEYTNKKAFDGLHDSPYYQGKMDIWTLFACQAIDKLNDGGYLSFIAPNSWLTNAGASIFRNKILSEGEILKFIDFGDFKVFREAGIQTMIFVFKKCTPKASYEVDYCKIEDKKLDEDMVKGFIENDLTEPMNGITKFKAKITPCELKDKSIAFLDNRIDKIINKIQNNNLEYLTSKEVGQGIIGAPDDCFIVNKDFTFNENELCFIKDFHTSVSRYTCTKSDKRIFYICERNFRGKQLENFENIYTHFKEHKDILTTSKEKYGTPNKPFFYLHRERDEDFFIAGDKIIAGSRVAKPSFYYTNAAFYGSRALNFIKTNRFNYKYLTGLLNSKLIAFWLKHQGKMLGDLYQINKEQIIQIPIAETGAEKQKQIALMVDELITNIKTLKNDLETALEAIKLNYGISNLSGKLDEFYKMGLNPFKDKLQNLGVNLDINKIEALITWYKEKSTHLLEIENKITSLEAQIDNEVYKLYELDSEDVKVIEKG